MSGNELSTQIDICCLLKPNAWAKCIVVVMLIKHYHKNPNNNFVGTFFCFKRFFLGFVFILFCRKQSACRHISSFHCFTQNQGKQETPASRPVGKGVHSWRYLYLEGILLVKNLGAYEILQHGHQNTEVKPCQGVQPTWPGWDTGILQVTPQQFVRLPQKMHTKWLGYIVLNMKGKYFVHERQTLSNTSPRKKIK